MNKIILLFSLALLLSVVIVEPRREDDDVTIDLPQLKRKAKMAQLRYSSRLLFSV